MEQLFERRLLCVDIRDHTRRRGLMHKAFTPRCGGAHAGRRRSSSVHAGAGWRALLPSLLRRLPEWELAIVPDQVGWNETALYGLSVAAGQVLSDINVSSSGQSWR